MTQPATAVQTDYSPRRAVLPHVQDGGDKRKKGFQQAAEVFAARSRSFIDFKSDVSPNEIRRAVLINGGLPRGERVVIIDDVQYRLCELYACRHSGRSKTHMTFSVMCEDMTRDQITLPIERLIRS